MTKHIGRPLSWAISRWQGRSMPAQHPWWETRQPGQHLWWAEGQPPRGSCGVSGQLRLSEYPRSNPLSSAIRPAVDQSLTRPLISGRNDQAVTGGLTRPWANGRDYQAFGQGFGAQSLADTSTLHGRELQGIRPSERLCTHPHLLLDLPRARASASLALSRPPAPHEDAAGHATGPPPSSKMAMLPVPQVAWPVAWPTGSQSGNAGHLQVLALGLPLLRGQASLPSFGTSPERKTLTKTDRQRAHTATRSVLSGWSGLQTSLGVSRFSREAHVQASAGSGEGEGQRTSEAGRAEAVGGGPVAAGAGAGGQPAAERNSAFATVQAEDLAVFRRIVGEAGVVVDPDELQPHNEDWMGKYRGSSQVMLRPKSTEEVSAILAHCNTRQLAVVPQGGNTGLVGGSVPVFDEIILSLGAMNRVRSWDPTSGAVVADAGVVLEALDSFVAAHGHMVPLDLGAKGSCQIGGNVSTNAGGLRVLRYGSLHGSVLGVEVVLPSGEVLDLLSPLRKDNAGYALKHLFIGSEGTLGVVTGVAILAPPRPQQVDVAFVAAPSYEAVLELFKGARQRLGELLSAFEFLDAAALAVALEHLEGVRDPLPATRAPFYALVETSSAGQGTACQERLTEFLEWAAEAGHVSDGTLAQDGQQLAAIWRVREGVAEALQRAGAVYKYDFSIPLPVMYELVKETRQRLDGIANTVSYGHLGDGNLHLNISAPKYDPEILRRLEPFVYEWVAAHRGSISAEHGLGRMKAKAIHYSRTPLAVKTMRQLKQLFDPSGILNPYKVLPEA